MSNEHKDEHNYFGKAAKHMFHLYTLGCGSGKYASGGNCLPCPIGTYNPHFIMHPCPSGY